MDVTTWLTVYPFWCRIDFISGLPLFGHSIYRKVIVPLEEKCVLSVPSPTQQLIYVDSSSHDANSVCGLRDTEFAEVKGMNIIIEEDLCLTPSCETHSQTLFDLDTLQQEALWLESAIRARITVSSWNTVISSLQTRNSPYMTHILSELALLWLGVLLTNRFWSWKEKILLTSWFSRWEVRICSRWHIFEQSRRVPRHSWITADVNYYYVDIQWELDQFTHQCHRVRK